MLCWALTTPVQFGVGARFYRAAWLSLTHGRTLTHSIMSVCFLTRMRPAPVSLLAPSTVAASFACRGGNCCFEYSMHIHIYLYIVVVLETNDFIV
jgi:hypothetical protein